MKLNWAGQDRTDAKMSSTIQKKTHANSTINKLVTSFFVFCFFCFWPLQFYGGVTSSNAFIRKRSLTRGEPNQTILEFVGRSI